VEVNEGVFFQLVELKGETRKRRRISFYNRHRLESRKILFEKMVGYIILREKGISETGEGNGSLGEKRMVSIYHHETLCKIE